MCVWGGGETQTLNVLEVQIPSLHAMGQPKEQSQHFNRHLRVRWQMINPYHSVNTAAKLD